MTKSNTPVVPEHEVQLKTADEMLDVLSPRKEPWNNKKNIVWLFRGQPSTAMNLLPRAWRDDYLNRLDFYAEDACGLVFFEGGFLRHFLDGCHRQGLRVPGEPSIINSTRTESHYMDPFVATPSTWPPKSLFPALALAQHHGVPTRLLDWSYRPYVSAYFAATGALSMEARPERLALWCLNTLSLRSLFGQPNPVEVLPVASDGNPNLAAQRGAFTIYRTNEVRHGKAQPVPLDKMLLERASASGRNPLDVLRCYSLPSSEAIELLRLLRAEGIDGAALYPGLHGAAEYALECTGFRWRGEQK